MRVVAAAMVMLLGAGACSVKVQQTAETPEGDFPCEVSSACPAPPSPCLASMCLEGQCVYVPAPNGVLPEASQVAGDCSTIYCDGEGGVYDQASPFDLPADDGNPCTEAVCDIDEPRQLDRIAGSRCGEDGVCNGTGRCGVCVPDETRCEVEASFASGVTTCTAEGEWSPPAACGPDAPRCAAATCHGVTAIAAGDHHACARFDDGAVVCWGADGNGQLGGGGLENAATPGWAARFRGQAFGRRHACALDAAGAVWCWGAGDFGQLGAGDFRSSGAPVQTATVARQVAVGRDHSCALRADGSVACWGRNDHGQAGSGRPGKSLGAIAAPPPAGKMGAPRLLVGPVAQALELGPRHSCLRQPGGAVCWGLLPFSRPEPVEPPEGETPTPEQKRRLRELDKGCVLEPTPVAGLDGAVAIALGRDHGCAQRRDGKVLCWGQGADGRLGTADAKDQAQAKPVPGLSGVTSLGVGDRFGCALDAAGNVRCWGRLGPGKDTALRSVAGAGPATSLRVGADFACALGRDGQVRCWGGASGASPTPIAWPAER